MYEIHIVRHKTRKNVGVRIDKEVFEKYGIGTSIECKEKKSVWGNGENKPHFEYSGIEKILREKCSFETEYDFNFRDFSLKGYKPKKFKSLQQFLFSNESLVLPYNWKMDESEIIKIAAKNDIKIIFEDSLSLKKDFVNHPLEIVLLHIGQCKFEDNLIYENYIVLRNLNTYSDYIDKVDKIYQRWPEDEREEDFTEELIYADEQLTPSAYDEGLRIMNSLAAMNCINRFFDCYIYNKTLIDDKFIEKMKEDHNISIIIKEAKKYE